jgi:hypothetical protein
MEVESWRNKKLSEEHVGEVCKLLYSLPRLSWKTARNFPPLALVAVNVPKYPEMFAMVLDYGLTPTQTQFVISALLDADGHLIYDPSGQLQVAVTDPRALSLLASCGPITTRWMSLRLCDS